MTRILTLLSLFLSLCVASANSQWVQTPDVQGANCFLSTDGVLYGGNTGILRFDGSVWQASHSGLPSGCSITGICLLNDQLFIATADNGIYTSSNNGDTWQFDHPGGSAHFSSLLAESGVMVAGLSNGGMLRSSNVGMSWVQAKLNDTSSTSHSVPGVYCLSSLNAVLYAGTSAGVFKSIDTGRTWNSISSGLPADKITAITAFSHTLYAGTMSNGVFRLEDHAAQWESVSTGLPAVQITSLGYDSATLYAGTLSEGIFQLTPTGNAWRAFNDGLSLAPISAIAMFDRQLFITTGLAAGGIWHRPLVRMERVEQDTRSGPVTISCLHGHVNIDGDVSKVYSISVFDLTGRRVLQESRLQGDLGVSVKIAQLPAGVYLCELAEQDRCIVAKLVVDK